MNMIIKDWNYERHRTRDRLFQYWLIQPYNPYKVMVADNIYLLVNNSDNNVDTDTAAQSSTTDNEENP